MSCYLVKQGSFIFNILLPVILMSLFSFVTEAMPCRKGFVLEEPGGIFNKFKSLVNTRSFASSSETDRIKIFIPQLRPREIKALRKKDIQMLELKQWFRFFSPRQLVLFTEEQRSWSRDLRQKFKEAEEIVKMQDEDPVYQIMIRERNKEQG